MFWLLLIFSYLLGSVSFAIILSKLTGKTDPRILGSGNPGATNILRTAGVRLAILTLLGDLCKGIIPIAIAYQLGFNVHKQAWIGVATVIGHLYPIYFHFKGGKGIATTAGMLVMLSPLVALLASLTWGIVFYLKRTSSLASLSGLLVILPLITWLTPAISLPIYLLCLLIIWRHRQNLHDLFTGHERHF